MGIDYALTDKIAHFLGKCNAEELDRVAEELTIYPRKAKKFAETITATLERSKQRLKDLDQALKG